MSSEQQPLDDLPQTDDDGKASFKVALDKLPTTTRPLEAQITVRLAESGGRAVERKLTLPVTPATDMIGVQAAVLRPLARRKRQCQLRRDPGHAGRQAAREDRPALRTAEDREPLSVVSPARLLELRAGEVDPPHRRRQVDVAADGPGRISLPVTWGRYRLDVSDGEPRRAVDLGRVRCRLLCRGRADTPDLLEIALDKPEYRAGDTMNVAVTARSDGRVTLNVVGDRMLSTVTPT